MTKILVLYYSSYGHTAQMAEAVAEGIREGGAEAVIRHVPETAPEEVVKSAGFQKMEGHTCIGGPDELADYDGIVVGSPTRYGRMTSQMAAFWDQTGGLWQKGALIGKVGAAFTSTASQHGGQETTLWSILNNLLHMGMTVVGLDYGYDGLVGVDEVKGGTPYGASTIADGDGSRQPSEVELGGARYLGKRVAQTAAKLGG
ncbi:NAD(P)H:quinone oxidoreductase [Qipengyuania pelagi]|jgi:NAD(P)H dehydrogenase (quinone)|uniref:NAD(P)H dehydrogenase (quinone) n=1 Tax=Qipengyuania pelagi TaxID=994320 RepID=A0A844Y7G2_9SPHN|nr:NAD(P)H:quinone oxidoreductase [Qipengyuania pelagi]MXO53881.1 NAD(P)H:quinone oxidoreductase [Qipengyuania pelagi]